MFPPVFEDKIPGLLFRQMGIQGAPLVCKLPAGLQF